MKRWLMKKMEMTRRFRNLVGVMVAGVFLTSCALGTDYVKLYDPLTYKKGTVTAYQDMPNVRPVVGEKIRVAIREVKDNRPYTPRKPNPLRIGTKKGAYGNPMGIISLEEGVDFVDSFTKNLINCFESAGYEVIPIKKFEGDVKVLIVDGEVRKFWVEFTPGLFIVDATSSVAFGVRVSEPETNRGIWSDAFDAETKVSGVAVTRGMFEESINASYAKAMWNLYKTISNETVRNMLRRTLIEKPSPDKANLPTKPQAIPPEKPVISVPVSPPSGTTIVTVTWTFANIRSGAGNNYSVVTTVKQGDKLTTIGESGEWFNVRLEDGKEGWISNKVVK